MCVCTHVCIRVYVHIRAHIVGQYVHTIQVSASQFYVLDVSLLVVTRLMGASVHGSQRTMAGGGIVDTFVG